MSASTVGVIGLGAMGGGVARSLLRAGFDVRVCDTRPDVRAAFAKEGAQAFASAGEMAQGCPAESVLFGPGGAVQAMTPGSVVIMSVTVAPEFARALGKRLAERRIDMLDAPVSGGAAKAAQGQMTIMGSGAPASFAKVQKVLAAIAQKVYRLGDEVGPGSTVKMINQLLAGVHIAAAAEAMALGIKAGADPATLYEVISNSAGSSWMFQNRVPHILAGDYTPLSAVNIFVKDLGIVLDAARRLTFPLPLTAAAHQMYLATSAHGHGGEDDSAVIKMFEALTRISLPEAGK
jgi:putative dehydrogenase